MAGLKHTNTSSATLHSGTPRLGNADHADVAVDRDHRSEGLREILRDEGDDGEGTKGDEGDEGDEGDRGRRGGRRGQPESTTSVSVFPTALPSMTCSEKGRSAVSLSLKSSFFLLPVSRSGDRRRAEGLAGMFRRLGEHRGKPDSPTEPVARTPGFIYLDTHMLCRVYSERGIRVRNHCGAEPPGDTEPAGLVTTVGGGDRASPSYAAADRVKAPASAARGRFRGIHGGRTAASLPAET